MIGRPAQTSCWAKPRVRGLAVVVSPWTKSGGVEASRSAGSGLWRPMATAPVRLAVDGAADVDQGRPLEGAAASESTQVSIAADREVAGR